jgi:lipoprotein-anchoring transpeptidase ErfK/SrfK
VRKFALLSISVASTLIGICGATSAPFSSQNSGQVWSLQTPFGMVYGIIPREVVDYRTARIAGIIVVNTSQRRLYYVLGGGKAIRYGIAVGMEGYAWSGVSTVTAKREWPDRNPTPGELQRFPNLPPPTWRGVQIIH